MLFLHSYSSNTIRNTAAREGGGEMRGLGQTKKKTLCTVYNLPTAICNTYNLHLKSLEIRLRDGKVSEGNGVIVKIWEGNTTHFSLSSCTVFLWPRTSQLVLINMHQSIWKLMAASWRGFIQFFDMSAQVQGLPLWFSSFRKELSMLTRIIFEYTLHLSSPFCKLSYIY